jgi:gamma-glutamyltranspeptidase/glutathione hydrolase
MRSRSLKRSHVRAGWLASAISASVALAACGGGDDGADGTLRSTEARIMALAGPEDSAAVEASVLELVKVKETRVDRTVYDYVYQVRVQGGDKALSAVRLAITSAGRGVTVLDGEVTLAALDAGASVLAADTVTLRQDRSYAFDAKALVWSVSATPVQTTVFDPALCTPQTGAPYGQTVGITGTNLMVTSADVQASAAGCRVLARGGTASDAAITVQAMLGVAEPFGSGLAGGTVITYYDAASKKVRTYEGLSAAPANVGASSTTSIYQMAVTSDLSCRTGQSLGGSISAQQGNTNISGRATGVPGTLRTLDLVHQNHGKLAWNQLWNDAIALAENGTPMTRYMYASLYSDGTEFDDETGEPLNAGPVRAWWNAARDRWGAARCKYKDIAARYCDPRDASGEKPLPVGTLIRNPELATTMSRVRDGGAATFYDPNGPIVAAILQRFKDDKQKADGSNNCTSILPATYNVAAGTTSAAITPARIPSLMTASDFANYRAVERKPLVGQHFGMTLYTQPAPSFGGLVALQSLGVLERKALASQAYGSPEFLYLVGEASRLANADRRNVIGDPAYSNVNTRVDALLSAPYLDQRAALLNGRALGTVTAGGTGQGIPAFVATSPASFDPLASVIVPAPDAQALARTLMAQRGQLAERDEDWNTTSSLAIVDGYGNALAMTTTINTHWGAHIEAAGMMLNNAMSNFSASAGSDVNGYGPNRRARSSIAPTIALDGQGRLKLVWGAAGGGPIPDYIVKTFLAHQVYGMDIQAAINADNWTGQGATASVAQFESGKPIVDQIAGLRSRYGYSATTLNASGLTSGLAGIAVSYDAQGKPTYHGAADDRRAGGANGY